MHYLQEWRAGTVSERAGRSVEKRECPADSAEHTHTHDGCWLEHGCRCAQCIHSRKMATQRRRNRLRAYGQTDQIGGDRVDAAPVRAHIERLLTEGIGGERIAEAAGVPRSVILDLRYGRRGKRPASQVRVLTTVLRAHAEPLLALTVDDIERAIVPSLGTVRRLRALVAIGWTQTEIAERMSMQVTNFTRLILGYRPRVTAATAEAADELFRALWSEPRTGGWNDRARQIAASRSWVGPLGWDDIDNDPEPASIDVSEQTKGERVLEDVEWLLEAGEPVAQITASLGRTAGAISKLAERHGRLDLARPFWTAANREQGAA
jgi:transcriptional regulator with XRE-family HTH domain